MSKKSLYADVLLCIISKKSSIFAENFKQADEKQVLNMDDRGGGSLPHGELQCAEG